jgi:hypothetical protein
MSQERIKSPEAVEVLERAITSLKTSVAEFHSYPNDEKLLLGVMAVWTDVNFEPELHKLIEDELRLKRMQMNAFGTLDISKGDPIRKRYDPYGWQEHVLEDYKSRPGEFYVMRCNSLVEFFETLKGQK